MTKTTQERIDALNAAIASGKVKPSEFSSSLLSQYATRGKLSEKQLEWVDKLANPEPPKTALLGGASMAAILTMFDKAAEHLKFPAIVLRTATNRDLRLYVAGEKSSTPGAVVVAQLADREYLGRILPGGLYTQSRKHADQGDVVELLSAFASNPTGVASAYGKLTGHCCFCNRTLKDERSLFAGYGPVCAARYGLDFPTMKQAKAKKAA